MILYLHGFRSSPHSAKARMIADMMRSQGRETEFACPALPASPAAAMDMALGCMEAHAPVSAWSVIGSSLGGFYATWLAEQSGCRAVLLNPAVDPRRDLRQQVGTTTAWHSGEPFEFTERHLEELAEFEIGAITRPERYFLVAAKGDEVLDWREMASRYGGARQWIVEGSDHGLSDFEEYLERIMAFCNAGAGMH